MLIIFDLDDTLVDTSGCITHHKLEDALLVMQNSGLVLPDFQEGLTLLRRLDKTAESAREALSEFLEVIDADKGLLEIGIKEIYEGISSELPLFALDGAHELLEELSRQHQLALVSNGVPLQQEEKLRKAGIDAGLFRRISISEERNKLKRYRSIAEELGYTSNQVLVCGDRIAADLTPAKELGFKTVQVRWGRGLNSVGLHRDVDYTVFSLNEIATIVLSLR